MLFCPAPQGFFLSALPAPPFFPTASRSVL
nr:MAG TPA: hypothetical protein [Caudoviricetes sp.]